MSSLVIAIDGPGGSGKSSVAKKLAEKLGFAYLDTGATYRALAYYFASSGTPLNPLSPKETAKLLKSFPLKCEEGRWFLGNKEITQELRKEAIGQLASQLAREELVRRHLVQWQQNFVRGKNVVAEGRDTTTVVFPRATLKVYLSARAAVRARRRFEELKKKESKASLAQIERELKLRDRRDRSRAIAPLRKSPEALCIDTTHLTILQVAEKIEKAWRKKNESSSRQKKKV